MWHSSAARLRKSHAKVEHGATGDAHVAIYKARYTYAYICVSCVCVLSLLALTCAKIHWSPTGGSLIFCCLAEGTGKREGGGAGGEGVTVVAARVGALAEVPLALPLALEAQPIIRLLWWHGDFMPVGG